MREIKFRAWDGKKMHNEQSSDYTFDEKGRWSLLVGGVHVTDFRTGTIMQYTGRNDKNGKEIYEGDIVRRNLKDLNYDKNHVISWDDMNARFYLGDEGPVMFHCAEDEVIGNIYEHQELIQLQDQVKK